MSVSNNHVGDKVKLYFQQKMMVANHKTHCLRSLKPTYTHLYVHIFISLPTHIYKNICIFISSHKTKQKCSPKTFKAESWNKGNKKGKIIYMYKPRQDRLKAFRYLVYSFSETLVTSDHNRQQNIHLYKLCIFIATPVLLTYKQSYRGEPKN